MAFLAIPLVEGAVVEFGPGLLAAGAALVGSMSLAGDTPKDKSDAKPDVRAVPRTGESCKKCPPEGGSRVHRNHGVNWNAYRYQAKVTGFAFDTEACRWSDEWEWLGIDFDGFQPAECLLQETKGNYDQFLDGSIPKADKFFKGFDSMESTAAKQASVVRANPPTRLMWYFQTPLAQQRMALTLRRLGISSVVQP